MPERLFSILDWHHNKRRYRPGPFTLEAISKIHTFYRNEANNTDDVVNTCHLEDILDLMDDSNNVTDATDLIQCNNDNHHALRIHYE